MKPKRILLAEDDEDDKQLFVDYLAERVDVVLLPVVENGVALEVYLEGLSTPDEYPDIIMLDQNMPKKNGMDTLCFLKADKRFAHIPVMIYSTYTDQQLAKDGIANGATLVLVKPISKSGYNEMIDLVFRSV